MGSDEVYFSTSSPLPFTHFFHRCCSAWIVWIKRVINSRYDIIIWTFQPMNITARPRTIAESSYLKSLGKPIREISFVVVVVIIVSTSLSSLSNHRSCLSHFLQICFFFYLHFCLLFFFFWYFSFCQHAKQNMNHSQNGISARLNYHYDQVFLSGRPEFALVILFCTDNTPNVVSLTDEDCHSH